MVKIAVLHGTLPQLLAQSSTVRAAGLDVVRSAADVGTFRAGLAMQRLDALVLDLGLLGTQPVREIDRLRKYTRARATIVTHGFIESQVLREVQERVDLIIVREPLTPTRLRGLLGRVLDEPGLTTEVPEPQRAAVPVENHRFDELLNQPAPTRRYTDVQLNRVFEEAIAADYEFTQHIAELLIHLAGLEDYCRRRNAGHHSRRGLHTDVERGVAHSRALFEEALARLTAATGLPVDVVEDTAGNATANVHDIASRRGDGTGKGGQP